MTELIDYLHNCRQKALKEARALLEEVERAGGKPTTDQKFEYDALLADAAQLRCLDELRQANEHEGIFMARLDEQRKQKFTGQALRDEKTGTTFRSLGPDDEYRSWANERADRETLKRLEGLTAGELMVGHATGQWRDTDVQERAMQGSDSVAGGYLLAAPLSSTLFDRARNQMVLNRLGMQTVPMMSSELHFGRVTGDPTAYWRQEGAAVTSSTMSFQRTTLRARSVAAIVPASLEWLADASNAAEIVERAMAEALALALDYAGLRGSGASAEPTGIRNYDDVVLTDLSAANFTMDDLIGLVSDVWQNNGMPTGMVMSPQSREYLHKLKNGEGNYLAIPQPVSDLTLVTSNQVPENLGAGSNTSETYVGDFANLYLGLRQNFSFEIIRGGTIGADNATSELKVFLRGWLRADFVAAHENHFAVLHNHLVA